MKSHAVMVITNKNGEFLFIRRSIRKKTLPGAWSFPSGTIEEGEEIFDAIKREGIEELNLYLEPIKILAEKKIPEFSSLLIFVLCSIKEGSPEIKEPDEIDTIEWMTFQHFFNKFSDGEIGHGLVWLRQNPGIWNNLLS